VIAGQPAPPHPPPRLPRHRRNIAAAFSEQPAQRGVSSERGGRSRPAGQLLADGIRNALPGIAHILGDARSFSPKI
jgi:hypothetical protein